jgi:alpha-L-rhamnosidase
MKHHSPCLLFFVLLSSIFLSCICAPAVTPKAYTGKGVMAAYLRCEYLVDPLGIDETAPRLSWEVESGQRGQRQSAYRLLVASSEDALKHDQGDLWDSGKVVSDQSIGAVYAGKPLASHQRCFWKVMLWDKDGQACAWSKSAPWSMGLLQPADWHAEWIGYDKPHQENLAEAPLAPAQWIWHAADEPGKVAQCQRLLLHQFELPKDAKIKQALLYATADDGMKFSLNGHLRLTTEAKDNGWQQARMIDVAAALRPGKNELRVLVENLKPSPAGLIARLAITTDKGESFVQLTDSTWKSFATPGEDWAKAKLDFAALTPVRVVGAYGAEPWGKIKFTDTFLPPPSYLRTQFDTDKAVARATLYAAALGLVDMHLNGHRVSDDYFNPGWTDYKKRVYYRTYDVTSLIRRGDNALGGVLADGWFSGYIGYRGARDHYGKFPRLRAQLHLEYADGTSADIGTGADWKASTGPELEADFLKGETYDARRERAWSVVNCDTASWEAVVVGSDEVRPLVQAHPGYPVRAFQEVKAKAITEPKPGVYVLNLDQNFAGVARLKVSGKPGQKIVLRFAERLNPDGTIYTTNLRSARATDTYICKGTGTETWQPRFTFHGFQYVEITGLDKKPSLDTITGVALSSDTPVVGDFQCSDPLFNQIHRNGYWTQRANFIDVPTDCPQRDERMGWTGDAQVYVRTATLNNDVQAFFKKWLVDLDTDSQRADGQLPCVAPLVVAGDDGGPAWADAGVLCPWTIYTAYGDTRILERHYDEMKRFVEFCRARSTSDLLPPKSFHCFGDWLSIKAETPKDVIYTAYFAHSTKLLANTAKALGKTEDAAQYNALFRDIRKAFNKAYVEPDGQIKGHTQTDYALAIDFDLVTGKKAKQAAEHLLAGIESRDYHLSTGFIGTKYLMLALSKIGRPDVAYRLLHNDTFPSWGFSIKQGATSIWERWDGWTPEKGFQDPGMNSFAHYSFGAVYQWMFENIGGISTSNAFKQVTIAPKLDDKLTAATVSYRSIHGLIVSDWKKQDGKLLLNVTVPANTTATVVLPAKALTDLTEGKHALDQAQGVKFLRLDKGNAYLAVESGKYAFATALP